MSELSRVLIDAELGADIRATLDGGAGPRSEAYAWAKRAENAARVLPEGIPVSITIPQLLRVIRVLSEAENTSGDGQLTMSWEIMRDRALDSVLGLRP